VLLFDSHKLVIEEDFLRVIESVVEVGQSGGGGSPGLALLIRWIAVDGRR
jgi:hypothetical protein